MRWWLGILLVWLIILKVTGVVDWPWWVILSPVWVVALVLSASVGWFYFWLWLWNQR